MVKSKFPASLDAEYTCSSSFLFLRFIVPVILNPDSFGINIGHVHSQTKRTLMLIGKSLQKLANFKEFSQEDSMSILNASFKSYIPKMKQFLDYVSSMQMEYIQERVVNKPDFSKACSEMVYHLDIIHKSKQILHQYSKYRELELALNEIERWTRHYKRRICFGDDIIDNRLYESSQSSQSELASSTSLTLEMEPLATITENDPQSCTNTNTSLPRLESPLQSESSHEGSCTLSTSPDAFLSSELLNKFCDFKDFRLTF